MPTFAFRFPCRLFTPGGSVADFVPMEDAGVLVRVQEASQRETHFVSQYRARSFAAALLSDGWRLASGG